MKEHLSDQSTLLEHKKTSRLFSLDLLKAMSISAVVSFHSIIIPKTTFADSQLVEEILFSPLKFCVPVFLTISFLLFERGMVKHTDSNWSAIKKRLVRVLITTIFWFSVAILLKLINANSWTELIENLLKGKIFTGAYYLLVLLQFIPIFILLRNWLAKPRFFVATILLQIFVFLCIYAIPSIPYHDKILSGLRTIDRPLFIYWFVYMGLGVYFCRNYLSLLKLSNRIPAKIKILLLLAYCLIQMFEYYWCFLNLAREIPPFDYAMFSCMLSVLVMFLCFTSIQENQLPSFVSTLVSMLSKYSLGIFCINGILTQILIALGSRFFSESIFSLPEIIILKLTVWILLLAISLGLSILLDRIGLKAVVR
jgi:Acyltransferase family